MPPACKTSISFTEASLDNLRQAGDDAEFMSLERAVGDYVKNLFG
ncbi:hypothetical protein FBZ93_12297 [Bradyrhizobium macuxiense]|uniref:Uncharacterized protein n=1 Tax=Bradyrhizobium macuxiense TaxID=1755647 RepID=A0A560KVN6_9BRAD|nr:hypothetical protein FBZ93_12297 [Bradyrhizobium macuxiense]